MKTEFSQADFAEMKKVERAVIAVLKPFNEHVHPALMMFAMIRCARVFLRKGDRAAQQELLPTIVAYMEGKTQPPGSHSLIWTPDSGEPQ